MSAKSAVPAALLCVLLAIIPAAASANSGPAYWESAPSFSITPLKDCPVTVEREDLTFDFSKNKNQSYSPCADVTAAYRMKNPTKQTVKVQMAFPLIARLPELLPTEDYHANSPVIGDTLAVSVDGKKVPFEIFPGSEMPEAGVAQNYAAESGGKTKAALPGFEQILKSISAKSSPRKIITGSGRRYDITVEQDGGIRAASSGKGVYLLSRGFNGMSSDGSSVELTSNCLKKGDSVSVLALGGKPTVTALTSDGKPNPSGRPEIQQSDCSVDDYVQEMLRNSHIFRADQAGNLLPRLVSSVEDHTESFFADGNLSFNESNLYDFLQQERLFVLCFETEFPAGNEQAVTVRYAMSGSMDERKTRDPVYSYAYLLNPAKGWADFLNLNIRIVPPAEAPNLITSSLSFRESHDGTYALSLPFLPKGDLTFSLYKYSQVVPNRSDSKDSNTFLLWAGAAAAVICLIAFLYKKKHKAV